MSYQKIGCIASNSRISKTAWGLLSSKYDLIDIRNNKESVDLIVVLGGDGFMLHTLHQYMSYNVPFYGMNSGTVGFLMNSFTENDLYEKIERATQTTINPLKMVAKSSYDTTHTSLAINEVYMLRQTNQAAKIKVSINDRIMINEMTCDGVIVSTPAGSSAYNFSAGGPVIPLDANILALTPLNPFRPRRWKGALLPRNSKITLEIMDYFKRPVSAVADFNEFRNITKVEIAEDPDRVIRLLFDPGHSLEDRILREQFAY